MGSPLGLLMANIFVGFHEKRLFDEVLTPYCNDHYVDDTIDSFASYNKANTFFQY